MDESRGNGRRSERVRTALDRAGERSEVGEARLAALPTSGITRDRVRPVEAPRKYPGIDAARKKPAASGNNSLAGAAIAFLTQRCAAPPEPTDDILVHAAQAGDARAFEILIERHQRAVFGYFRARVLEAADAEDLCQEVFMRCFQMPVSFEAPVMVRPWLMGIARNVLREHIRKLTRRREVAWSSLCLDVDDGTELCDGKYDEMVGHLPGCIETLGGSARDALDMYYRCRMRLADIGERLRRSEGAVKLLIYRARQALKQCLSRKCECPGGESA